MAEILIVDDAKDDLESMGVILEKNGYKVTTAGNGADALELLNGNGFDLILIDIMMPTLSGYDLLRLLRERLNHHVKLVYVSIVPKQDVSMADADGFIQKPFSEETFVGVIENALGK